MDQKVLKTQQWLNQTYGDNSNFEKLELDGITGVGTVRALIKGLQIELGINNIDGIWGNTTKNYFDEYFPNGLSESTDSEVQKNKNIIYILQGGCYCRGIEPGGFDGVFGETLTAKIKEFRNEIGVDSTTGIVIGNIIGAILTTDSYKLDPNKGDAKIRQIQLQLNGKYSDLIGIIPTNGIYDKKTHKGLIKSLQHEIGVSADGVWGNNTMNACPTLQRGSTKKNLVYILQYALYVNGFDPNGFDGGFGNGVVSAVKNFQELVKLSSDGIVGKQTWASLMISYGDKNRVGTACDCITTITVARAQALKAKGYTTVGRYLTNARNSSLDKNIKENELNTIVSQGLTVFPIFQTWGIFAKYFNEGQGKTDAIEAYNAARAYGFKQNTIIYFAVDYDNYESEIESNLVPYFKAINSKMSEFNNYYKIGIYGTRKACREISNRNLAVSSFVSDMSSGYSGNIGQKMPDNWAYDQISTVTVGSGDGKIEIDNDISRATGCSSFDTPITAPTYDNENTLDPNEKEAIISEVSTYISNNMSAGQVAKALRSRSDAVRSVIDNDEKITQISNQYKIRKALIQTVFAWEYCLEGYDDIAADTAVTNYYSYQKEVEHWYSLSPTAQALTPFPTLLVPNADDSSTGCCQIFAKTAINARNYAIGLRLLEGEKYDISNWKHMDEVWTNLHNSIDYSIEASAMVLLHAANMMGLSEFTHQYSSDDIKKVLQRYNGTNDAAVEYGKRNYGIYEIFEKYNRNRRNS